MAPQPDGFQDKSPQQVSGSFFRKHSIVLSSKVKQTTTIKNNLPWNLRTVTDKKEK